MLRDEAQSESNASLYFPQISLMRPMIAHQHQQHHQRLWFVPPNIQRQPSPPQTISSTSNEILAQSTANALIGRPYQILSPSVAAENNLQLMNPSSSSISSISNSCDDSYLMQLHQQRHEYSNSRQH